MNPDITYPAAIIMTMVGFFSSCILHSHAAKSKPSRNVAAYGWCSVYFGGMSVMLLMRALKWCSPVYIDREIITGPVQLWWLFCFSGMAFCKAWVVQRHANMEIAAGLRRHEWPRLTMLLIASGAVMLSGCQRPSETHVLSDERFLAAVTPIVKGVASTQPAARQAELNDLLRAQELNVEAYKKAVK